MFATVRAEEATGKPSCGRLDVESEIATTKRERSDLGERRAWTGDSCGDRCNSERPAQARMVPST